MLIVKSKNRYYAFSDYDNVFSIKNFNMTDGEKLATIAGVGAAGLGAAGLAGLTGYGIYKIIKGNENKNLYKKLPEGTVVGDAALRAAVPLGNTAGVVTGGQSGRKYHAKNWIGGALGSIAASTAVSAPLMVAGVNPMTAASLAAPAGYIGKVAGSALTAKYQKRDKI